MSNLRRVPKSEAQTKFKAADPVDICLECWKEWMSYDSERYGPKTMSGLESNTDGYGRDSSEEQRAYDNKIGAATMAVIDSLSTRDRWAVYGSCGISTVCNFPNADLATVFAEARIRLEAGLRKNICTTMLF